MKPNLLMFVLFVSAFSFAQQNERNFYNPNNNGTATVTISNLTGGENTTDSRTLNNAIRNLSNQTTSNKKGGTITVVPNGNRNVFYLANINILSNVHLKIDSRITIIPQRIGARVFEIGERGFVENVALTSTREDSSSRNNAFKVKMRAGVNKNESALRIGNVKNFKVAGMDIDDKKTKISGITMSTEKGSSDKSKIPVDGVMKNLWISDAHVGYGLIQAQAAKHVLFKNLEGQGGITLRFESGNDQMLRSTGSSIDRVFAEGVIVRNGDAALNMSPHRSNQGSVNATGIKAFSSTWAVQASKGFISTEGVGNGYANNKGSFGNVRVTIDQITAGTQAQIKGKDFPRFRCDPDEKARLQAAFTAEVKRTEASVRGKSIGGARTSASIDCSGQGCYGVNITYASASNTSGTFQQGPGGFGDERPNCNSRRLSVNDNKVATEFSVSPNPASDLIIINNQVGNTVTIYDTSGTEVKSITNVDKASSKVNVTNLVSGLYIVRSTSKSGKTSTQKLIIK